MRVMMTYLDVPRQPTPSPRKSNPSMMRTIKSFTLSPDYKRRGQAPDYKPPLTTVGGRRLGPAFPQAPDCHSRRSLAGIQKKGRHDQTCRHHHATHGCAPLMKELEKAFDKVLPLAVVSDQYGPLATGHHDTEVAMNGSSARGISLMTPAANAVNGHSLACEVLVGVNPYVARTSFGVS